VSLEPFIEAGLYDPAAPKAAERRELLEHLLGRGFSTEEVVAAGSRLVQMFDVAVALTRPLPARLTLADVAERCDASVEELAAVRSALGFTVAAEDVPDVPETFVEDFALYRLACGQYGREETLAFVRVLGVAVVTITEGARELFTSALREASATELEASQANELGIAAWDNLSRLIGHLMVERTSRDLWFEVELLRGDLTMAVVFVDLVGSTAWAAHRSSAQHAVALSRFELTAAHLATTHGGRVVKFIGDEAMIVANDPVAATAIAVALCAAAAADPTLPPARGAVGYGNVTARSGDYFGPLVNLTSRATKAAAPNKVIVTTTVAQHLDPRSWVLSRARPITLRGIAQPVELVEVDRADLKET
jgi:class 3 adenylate cyclase